MMDVCFSIIVPLYNKRRQVFDTVQSILQQSHSKFELIVVNDGSTDGSETIVSSIDDPRILLINQPNGGVSSARNRGIMAAKYEWLFIMDGDDTLFPDALSCFASMIMKHPGHKLYTALSAYKNGHIKSSGKIKVSRHPFFDTWTNRHSLGPGHSVVHKSVFEKFGYYDERMCFYEDWELSLRLLQAGSVVYVNHRVMVYNQDGTGLSASAHDIKKEMAYYVPEILEKTHPGFWYKALLFENIEATKYAWSLTDSPNVSLYEQMQRTNFGTVFSMLHNIRQRMLNHHWI